LEESTGGRREKFIPVVVPARPPARPGAPAPWEARGLGSAVPQGAEDFGRHLLDYIIFSCMSINVFYVFC